MSFTRKTDAWFLSNNSKKNKSFGFILSKTQKLSFHFPKDFVVWKENNFCTWGQRKFLILFLNIGTKCNWYPSEREHVYGKQKILLRVRCSSCSCHVFLKVVAFFSSWRKWKMSFLWIYLSDSVKLETIVKVWKSGFDCLSKKVHLLVCFLNKRTVGTLNQGGKKEDNFYVFHKIKAILVLNNLAFVLNFWKVPQKIIKTLLIKFIWKNLRSYF